MFSGDALYPEHEVCRLLGVTPKWLRSHFPALGKGKKIWYRGADLVAGFEFRACSAGVEGGEVAAPKPRSSRGRAVPPSSSERASARRLRFLKADGGAPRS
jgi:hypothetical protein